MQANLIHVQFFTMRNPTANWTPTFWEFRVRVLVPPTTQEGIWGLPNSMRQPLNSQAEARDENHHRLLVKEPCDATLNVETTVLDA